MKTKKPSLVQLQALYLRWLKGESLRQIARSIGVRHGTVDVWFDSTFGKQATDPTANSLVRSMLEDYPDDPVVLLWAAGWAKKGQLETLQHRSKHSMGQLTKFQCLHDDGLMDVLATSNDAEADPWDATRDSLDFLRLSLYQMVAEQVATALLSHLFSVMLAYRTQSKGIDQTA